MKIELDEKQKKLALEAMDEIAEELIGEDEPKSDEEWENMVKGCVDYFVAYVNEQMLKKDET